MVCKVSSAISWNVLGQPVSIFVFFGTAQATASFCIVIVLACILVAALSKRKIGPSLAAVLVFF